MKLAESLKEIKLDNGNSVFEHVNLIIRKMIQNDEKDPLRNFEKYSESLREQIGEEESDRLIRDNGKEFAQRINQLREFLKIEKKKPVELDEEGNPIE